jgi:hypothetical protein
MRKLLVLLSVVLLFAICQSQKVKDKKDLPKIKRDCFFGYKKVNGTKVCKTKEEFLKHPRNETNCPVNKTLICYKFGNITACLCIKVHKPATPIIRTNCTKGYVRRCKFNKIYGIQSCRCVKMGPIIPVDKPEDVVCEEGKEKICKKNGVCICRKKRPEIVLPVVPKEVI